MKVYLASLLANTQPYSSEREAKKRTVEFGMRHTKLDIPGLEEAFKDKKYNKCVRLWNDYCNSYFYNTHYLIKIKEVQIDSEFS